MGSQGEEESDFACVVDNLVTMFGHIVTREAIETVVDSCEGDLNLSMDAIMKITNEDTQEKKDEASSSTSQQPSLVTETTTSVKETQERETTVSHATQGSQSVTESPQSGTPFSYPAQGNQSMTKLNQSEPPISYATQASHSATQFQQNGSPISYAAQAIQYRGAVPKQTQRPINPAQHFWTNQIRQIITEYNQGSRIMIFMRGVPGSGKSYLAKSLVETMVSPADIHLNTYIFSTDAYFFVRGQYLYDRYKLSNAHVWNQNRVKDAANSGLSPIIIDNTNIEMWEMQPYVTDGMRNGYIIEVVEPTTPWVKKATQLFKRNTHNVPLMKIRKMLDNYTNGITGEILMKSFRLYYPANMKPPVKRLIPPIVINAEQKSQESEIQAENLKGIQLRQSPERLIEDTHKPLLISNKISKENQEANDQEEYLLQDDLTPEQLTKQKLLQEAQKQLEEIEKVEEEWEKGDKWDVDRSNYQGKTAFNSKNSIAIANLEAKPQRKAIRDSEIDSVINSDNIFIESDKPTGSDQPITFLMPPWFENHEQPKSNQEAVLEVPVETSTNGTCVESGDTDIPGIFKIISATARDINEFYLPPQRNKIPQKQMLHKGSMTHDINMMTVHCPQKERHFLAFRKLFKHIERDSLRFIFDNCCGDVNWAVENVLGEANYELKKTSEDEESDTEEENQASSDFPCNCLAIYGIEPQDFDANAVQSISTTKTSQRSSASSTPQHEKKKKDATISEETMHLKKQIEQNFVISDTHYSEHCLKIRKMRRGENTKEEDVSQEPSTSGTPDAASQVNASNITESNSESSDEDNSSTTSSTDIDRIVNINVGQSFIKELDKTYGRSEIEYPENVSYNISLPSSLLNEINALWMESLMFQLDEQAKKSAAMVKQDEEFARQIAFKEAELSRAGEEPAVPDFKEIMDLELAISLHMKDMSEWKNNIPQDMAAKMTHNKLFNVFPEIDKDTLLELLMAHDNDFKATVEVLLVSTGKGEILETENGVNKFMMQKQLEEQGKVLEEQRKELSEVEWPTLSQSHEKVDMSLIQAYRDEADLHLNRRNLDRQKAEEYIRRGMTQVANYYSELAHFHRSKYEHANSMAVAALMQYHANNSTDGETVDLHYFRVKEAMQTLDIFIDTHIQKLREANKPFITLFFITGRGLHSPGRPKIKPAVMKRIRARGLFYTQCNPGLLRARISSTDKLSYQVT